MHEQVFRTEQRVDFGNIPKMEEGWLGNKLVPETPRISTCGFTLLAYFPSLAEGYSYGKVGLAFTLSLAYE